MKKSQIIKFIRSKDFKYVKEIGQGGTGRTVLLYDEIIDENFVCKKYSPYNEEYKDEFFDNFVDEIKILHKIFHKNIVRIFNYYLYPEQKTGYILMDYIIGTNIEDYISQFPEKINEVFHQIIQGFKYLEKRGILHRDIRPDNILVSEEGISKIIDFGFGKNLKLEDDFKKSITLNWYYPIPNEFKDGLYDYKSEIYFIGRLFEKMINDNDLSEFKYHELLNEMIDLDYAKRVESFDIIERRIFSTQKSDIKFSKIQKETYQNFADNLTIILAEIDFNTSYNEDITTIIRDLENVYKNSILEDNIVNPNAILRIFLKGDYKYYQEKQFDKVCLLKFLKMLKSVSNDRQRLILNNLWQRFDIINRYAGDLPF